MKLFLLLLLVSNIYCFNLITFKLNTTLRHLKNKIKRVKINGRGRKWFNKYEEWLYINDNLDLIEYEL